LSYALNRPGETVCEYSSDTRTAQQRTFYISGCLCRAAAQQRDNCCPCCQLGAPLNTSCLYRMRNATLYARCAYVPICLQLLDAALAGYHVTIFAYGQTGEPSLIALCTSTCRIRRKET
jgi:hypothetical protein